MKWIFAVVALACCASPPASAPATPPPPPLPAVPPRPVLAVMPGGSLTVGDHHTCAVAATGEVMCWGQGGAGRLGVPDDLDRLVPTPVPGLTDVAGIAASRDVTCAWTVHGAVWCWGGDEGSNRAGDHRPRRVPGLDDVVQVIAGFSGACGLRKSGHVACWTADHWQDPLWPPPTELAGLTNAVEIAGDDQHLCARTATSEVVCAQIKDDARFELRDQTMTPIPELAGATSLAGRNEVFAALLPGHRLASWDIADLEGRRSPAPDKLIHWATDDGTRVIVGSERARDRICVLGERTTCWGSEALGAPTRVIPRPLQDLAIGEEVSCARAADRLECWGLIGRTGDGSSELPSEPVEVKGLTDARQLEAGFDTMCVLRATGHVACWGARDIAMTPDGKPIIDYEPAELPGVDDAVEIAMSSDTVCARRRAGGTTCWSTSRDGTRTAVESREMAGATRILSSALEVCGTDNRGQLGCRRAEIPAMEVGDAGRHELEANLTVGRPCATDDRHDTHCWHGPLNIIRSYTQNYAVECEVKAGKIVCHYGDDQKRTFDPMPEVDHVVSYDGMYAVTADGRVHRAGQLLYPGRPPIEKLAGIVELREGRVLCGRHADGTVVCWGPRDYLGAGQRGTPGDPTPVPGLVLGAPRPISPVASPPPPIAEPPAGPAVTLTSTPMKGPFPDRLHACSVQTCSAKQELDCELDDREGPRAMASPPAPFTEVRLLAINCRDPEYTRDGSMAYRLIVKRPDGYWITAPLFRVGGNDHYCGASTEVTWEARDLVAGGDPEIALTVLARTSCRGGNGGDDEDLGLLVVAASAKQPQSFAAIPIAEGGSCTGTDCAATSTKLDLSWTADGQLGIGGPATWNDIRRSKAGALEAPDASKQVKTPIGRYRFVTR